MLLMILLTLSGAAIVTSSTTVTRVVSIEDENAEKAILTILNVIILPAMLLATVIICISCSLQQT